MRDGSRVATYRDHDGYRQGRDDGARAMRARSFVPGESNGERVSQYHYRGGWTQGA